MHFFVYAAAHAKLVKSGLVDAPFMYLGALNKF